MYVRLYLKGHDWIESVNHELRAVSRQLMNMLITPLWDVVENAESLQGERDKMCLRLNRKKKNPKPFLMQWQVKEISWLNGFKNPASSNSRLYCNLFRTSRQLKLCMQSVVVQLICFTQWEAQAVSLIASRLTTTDFDPHYTSTYQIFSIRLYHHH